MNKLYVILGLAITALMAIIIIPTISTQIDAIEEQNTVLVQGKNLFDASTATSGIISDADGTVTTGGANITVVGALITIETTDVSGFRGLVSDFIEIEGSTDYTLSGLDTDGTSNNPYAPKGFFFYDENQNFVGHAITNINFGSGDTSLTYTSPSNARYVRFSIVNASQVTSTITNVQFEQSSGATAYEAYSLVEVGSANFVTNMMRILPLVAVVVIVAYFVVETKIKQ